MDLVEMSASTSEYVAAHAMAEPSRPAVIFGEQVVTYGVLYQHIKNFTLGLHELGVKPGEKCIIKISHPYVHWLIILALENLAAISCSAKFEEEQTLWDLYDCMDKVISQDELPIDIKSNHVHLAGNWVQKHLDKVSDAASYQKIVRHFGPMAGQRVKRSSGTTGGVKAMLSLHQGEESLIKAYSEVMGFTKDTRYLVANIFVITSVQLCATLCLRLGALVIFEMGAHRLKLVEKHRVTHMRLFQSQLLDTLKMVEGVGHVKPLNLTVILGASPISQILWDRILNVLGTNIVYTYNANECGSICNMKPGGLGVVRAGVQVSIVDNDDRTLPEGETGRIRVKTPTMVMGYLNNEQASQRNYKDGWFYTGDAGCFVGERQLKLMGRVDDVINLAGFKHSCVEFETIAESIDGIEEACVTTAPDQQGIDRLVIIGVLSPAVEKQKILERIRTLFPPIILEGGRVLFTDKLIRNESGKLNRKAMQLSIGQAPAA